MKTPWHHPDLEPLFRAVRTARAEQTQSDPEQRADFERGLNALYREIGLRVFSLAAVTESKEEAPKIKRTPPSISVVPTIHPPPKKPKANIDSTTITVKHEAPQWCHSVVSLLHLTEPPEVLHAYTDLSVEAARLHWATLSIQSLDDEVPVSILTGLFGLLSARCHHLTTQIENPWIPNTVLREVAGRAQLMNIEGLGSLCTPPKSIFGDWFEEALHWWDVIQHGLQPHLEANQ